MTQRDSNRCLFCGSSNLKYVRKYRTDSIYGKHLFKKTSLHICENCSFVQTVPVPPLKELADYYETKYRLGRRYGADVANTSEFPYDNLFYLNRGRSIASLVNKYFDRTTLNGKMKILDVGTGFGHVLHAFGKKFPNSERYAIEISDVCVDHLRSLGIHVFTEPAETALSNIKEKFDVIVLSHLFEHLANPADFLRLLHSRLTQNGLLYIEVPNIPVESLKKYPDHQWAPRVDEPHITFFTKETLSAMLEKMDYDVMFCDTAGYYYKYISAFRFSLPKLKPFIINLLPRGLFSFLRSQKITNSLRVQERETSFYQYGGFRIWIRSVSKANTNHN